MNQRLFVQQRFGDSGEILSVRTGDDAGAGCGRLKHVVTAVGPDAAADKNDLGERIHSAQFANRVQQDDIAAAVVLAAFRGPARPRQARVFQ